MQDSHTAASIDEPTADSSLLRLVGASTVGLPHWLAGRVDEHLATFAAHMTQGLLAASTAVGLEVMAEPVQGWVVLAARPGHGHGLTSSSCPSRHLAGLPDNMAI